MATSRRALLAITLFASKGIARQLNYIQMPPPLNRRLLIPLGIFVALVILFFVSLFTPARASLAGIPIGFQSDRALQDALARRLATFESDDLVLRTSTTEFHLTAHSLALSADLAASVRSARAQLAHETFGDRLRRLAIGEDIPATISYEQDHLAALVSEWEQELDTPTTDAALQLHAGEAVVTPEQAGARLSLTLALRRLDDSLSHFQGGGFTLPVALTAPLVRSVDLVGLQTQLSRWASAPVTLASSDGSYSTTLSPADIAGLVTIRDSAASEGTLRIPSDLVAYLQTLFIPDPMSRARLQSSVQAGLDTKLVSAYADQVATRIDRPAQNLLLAPGPGPVQIASVSDPGRTVDRPAFQAALLTALGQTTDRTVQIPVQTVQADVNESNLASLGVTDLVSEGTSDFGNSPANRVFNIKVGVSKFKSVLVRPGATFSFNDVLGPVDASTGYLPELVILQDKTTPQFGGGLCQVSSTAWRGALDLGVPTIARQSHAYPVSYYFPLGTDATIYLPYPDMQWKNTTGAALVIQARVVGTHVYFDYYGTPTGWQVNFSRNGNMSPSVAVAEQLPPYAFNVKSDGSEDTVFYRTVTDQGGGVVLSDHYVSHYDSPSKFPHTQTQ